MTLTQFIAKRTGLGKRHAKKLLENGDIMLNGQPVTDGTLPLGKFDHLSAAGDILQAHTPRYILLHKPSGIVSATTDKDHQTVIDLIDEPWATELHLAGRLDRSTTGLVILTNDSKFSESLTRPESKIPKTYLVTTDLPIPPVAIAKFRSGMSFDKEKIRTHPATVDLLSENECRLTIFEGKHHQIKRMFLRFGIRVTKLHRESVGAYRLPADLAPGKWRKIPSMKINHSEELRNRWLSICNKIDLDGNVVWDELSSNYTASELAYHNLHHIQDCLVQFDKFAHLAENPLAVEMAIWFHDTIYDTHSNSNEEDSSLLAKSFLGDSSFSEIVAALIIATKHDSLPSSQDATLICDIDLSILGRQPDRYLAYSEAIRNEYSWVPINDYRSARVRVLKSFLQRSKIFGTEEFHHLYETQARTNIQSELNQLLESRACDRH